MSTYDWRKHASMTAADDTQVEKAFMDQAYGFIANKAGPLMKDPHRLGFEVVSKNDENTRMVGIFAFRLSSDLLYAPVFFINGEIKGTDLLYRHDTKSFVPLNEEWVTWLIEKNEQDSGQGLDKGMRKWTQPEVMLSSLTSPGGSGATKIASEVLKGIEAAAGCTLQEWAEHASMLTEPEPVLRRFILEDGKQAAVKVIEKALGNMKFAEALLTACDIDTFAPSELPDVLAADAAASIKQASEPKLVLYLGGPPAGIKEAAEDFYRKGYMLVDSRTKAEDEMSVVYEDNVRDIEQFSGPGLYDVLMKDGTTQKAFVAREADDDWDDCCPSPCCDSPSGINTRMEDSVRTIVVLKDGNAGSRSKVMGKFLKDIGQCRKDGDLKDSMSVGKTYRVFQGGKGTLSGPINITGRKSRNGITTYTARIRYRDKERTIIHNPEFSGSSLPEDILGDDALFIPVGATIKVENDYASWDLKDDVPTGDRSALENWVWASGGLSRASLKKASSGEYYLKSAHGTGNLVGRMDALVGLARDFRINGDTAQDLLEAADRDGGIEFWLEPHEKQASRVMSLLGSPNFTESYDDVFGAAVQQPQSFNLDTEQQIDQPEDPRIGDAWDPKSADGLPSALIQQLPPEELQQLADLHKLPHVFEHGMVGSLAKTFDSSAMISKYLPGFEKALDSMGRVLFLFYWKPGDFEDAYGTDDMTNMENELLSNFKSFGQLVLNLLKKTKRQAEGSPALPT